MINRTCYAFAWHTKCLHKTNLAKEQQLTTNSKPVSVQPIAIYFDTFTYIQCGK
jgi:hypothetical protein